MQMPQTPGEFAEEALYAALIGGLASVLVRFFSPTVSNVGFALTGAIVVVLLVIAGVSKAVQVGIRSSRD